MSISISIITASFNSALTLPDTVKSIDLQSYENWEHLIVDGGSSDDTKLLFTKRESVRRHFVSEPDAGIYDALNKGIIRSSGDVIGLLHSDDVFADEHVLARVASAFDDPNVNAVYGDLVYVDKGDGATVIRYWIAGDFDFRRLRDGWMPPHPTVFLRRSVYEKIGNFDLNYKIAADYEFLLRLFCSGCVSPRYLNNVLVRMRVGGASNKSLKNILVKSSEDLRAIRSHGVGGVRTLVMKNLIKIPQFFSMPAG